METAVVYVVLVLSGLMADGATKQLSILQPSLEVCEAKKEEFMRMAAESDPTTQFMAVCSERTP